MVKGFWMGAAHVAGGTARSVGGSAKNLDPAHRRDGVAFLLLGLAVVIAVREWFGLSGTAGDYIHAAIAGAVGVLGIAIPIILLFFAVRLMRHPDRPEVNGRMTIGITAMTTAVAGLVAVAAGLPDPPDWDAVFDAGGLLGWVAANPLSTALTVYVTVPVLVLLLVFGLLVLTATPVAAILRRFRQAIDWISGRDIGDEEDEAEAPSSSAEPEDRPARKPRKRKADSAPEVEPGGYQGTRRSTGPRTSPHRSTSAA